MNTELNQAISEIKSSMLGFDEGAPKTRAQAMVMNAILSGKIKIEVEDNEEVGGIPE